MNQGGTRPGAGRKKGSTGEKAQVKRKLGATVLSDGLEEKLWAKYLNSEDERIAWEAFKLAKMYKSGQPPKSPQDRHDNESRIIVQFVRDPETPSVKTPDKPIL